MSWESFRELPPHIQRDREITLVRWHKQVLRDLANVKCTNRFQEEALKKKKESTK